MTYNSESATCEFYQAYADLMEENRYDWQIETILIRIVFNTTHVRTLIDEQSNLLGFYNREEILSQHQGGKHNSQYLLFFISHWKKYLTYNFHLLSTCCR
ncbi:BAG_1a_G0002550.mRNA.1.CDS.1 [Saccharomyces cerevisiae]|nr:BAG_1a_G0002550.mRNA.1.CDS.1 [Saccharomyces cerevisiae]CAI7042825.1 BAG_1a_G0002550.mRNA.1.CDS.1 [Saccharomyces cerevisiae]